MKSAEDSVRHLVRQWLRHAEEDLLVARELMERERLSYDPVGFHAQQAAEKFLKALLTRYGVAFPKTHSIFILLQLAGPVFPDLLDRLHTAHTLTPYGVEIRYPTEVPRLTRAGGEEAVRLAAVVRDEVMRRLDDYLKGETP
jgi:HEPN domain-containing protein